MMSVYYICIGEGRHPEVSFDDGILDEECLAGRSPVYGPRTREQS